MKVGGTPLVKGQVNREMPMQTVRVAIHAPDPITKVGLSTFLNSRPEFTVSDEGPPRGCDVALLATERVTADVLGIVRHWAETAEVPVVLLANDLRETDLLTLVECRVVAMLRRRSAIGERLVSAIVAANSGGGLLPSDLLGDLLAQIKRIQSDVLAPRGLNSSGLTPREIEVLRLIADGRDTNMIAEQLRYSERTVKNIISGLTGRLKVRNRTQAVAYALRAGII